MCPTVPFVPKPGYWSLFQKYNLRTSIFTLFSPTPSPLHLKTIYTQGSLWPSKPSSALPPNCYQQNRQLHHLFILLLMRDACFPLNSQWHSSLYFSNNAMWHNPCSQEFAADCKSLRERRPTRTEIWQLESSLNSFLPFLRILGPAMHRDLLAMLSTKFYVELSSWLFKNETVFCGIKWEIKKKNILMRFLLARKGGF